MTGIYFLAATTAAAFMAYAAHAQQNAGIAASFSEAGTQYLLDQIIPLIETDFGHVSIPDIPWDQDGFEGTISAITCTSFTVGSGTVTMAAPNVLGASLADIGVTCSANWDFKLKIWPHEPSGSGSVDAQVSQTTASIATALGVTSNGHASLACSSADISIGSVDMTFHGSLWDWLLNLFKGLIENAVKGAVSGAFSSTVTGLINTDANKFLAGIPTELPIGVKAPYDISEVRFGLTQAPSTTAAYLGVFLQGDIVPLAAPVPPAGIPPPALPPFSPAAASSYVQLLLSPYTLLTAAATYYDAGLTTFSIDPKDIPLGLNVTDAWGLIAPGMLTAFPHGTPVAITAYLVGIPNATISTAGVAVSVPAVFAFSALNGSTPAPIAFSLSALAALDLTLGVAPNPLVPGGLLINGTLAYLSATLGMGSSTVGPVSVALLGDLVDLTCAGVLVPAVNGLLAAGLPLPSAPGMVLEGAAIDYQTGYVELQSNFTFAPSSGHEGLARQAAPAMRTMAKPRRS